MKGMRFRQHNARVFPYAKQGQQQRDNRARIYSRRGVKVRKLNAESKGKAPNMHDRPGHVQRSVSSDRLTILDRVPSARPTCSGYS